MQGDPFEPEQLEDRLEDASLRGGELDELEAVELHGILNAAVFHDWIPICRMLRG